MKVGDTVKFKKGPKTHWRGIVEKLDPDRLRHALPNVSLDAALVRWSKDMCDEESYRGNTMWVPNSHLETASASR